MSEDQNLTRKEGKPLKLSDHLYLVGGGGFSLSQAFDSNVYIVETATSLVMVDTGAGYDTGKLISNVEYIKQGLGNKQLTKVLLTHAHADHSGGAYELRERYGCEVYIGEQEAELVQTGTEKEMGLEAAKQSGFYCSEYTFRHCEITARLKHSEVIKADNTEIHALSVPSHSPGSMCYLVEFPEGRALFSGDVVFLNGIIGLLNIDGSSLSGYRRYIRRLEDLEVDILLPGHNMFAMEAGQKHIDMAVASLKRIQIPRNFI